MGVNLEWVSSGWREWKILHIPVFRIWTNNLVAPSSLQQTIHIISFTPSKRAALEGHINIKHN